MTDMIKREEQSEIRRQLTMMGYSDLAANQRVVNAIRDLINYSRDETTDKEGRDE